MHRRFAHSPLITLRLPGGTVHASVATGWRMRLLGLMGLPGEEITPLLLPRCRSVHTIGMRSPIDIVWLGMNGESSRVIGVVESLGPQRHARAPQSAGPNVAALELSPGSAASLVG